MNNLPKKILKSKKNIFITGPAGSGKSYLLNQIVEYAQTNNILAAVTASTGTAAINVNGITIHKFLGFGIQQNKQYVKTLIEKPYWPRIAADINKIDAVIIDEISMISNKQIELIDTIMKEARHSSKAFGGLQMIFVGDFLQLPPIGRGVGYAFESLSWKEGDINVINLTNNYRQKETDFRELLNAIRIGDSSNISKHKEILLDREIKQMDVDPEKTILVSKNDRANKYNLFKLDELKGKEYKFSAIGKGEKEYKNSLSKSVLADETLIVKKHARIIMLVNDVDGKYINGTQGYVANVFASKDGKEYITLELDNGNIVDVHKYTWTAKDYNDKVLASYEQFPLKLAWGITIHKSQGATIEDLHIDFAGLFAPSAMYVALSRTTSLDKLTVSNLRNARNMTDPKAKRYYEILLNKD